MLADIAIATDAEIVARRGPKNIIDPFQPYAFFVEREVSRLGRLEAAAVILLTNRECPFRCLMCDLWQNTLNERVPTGAIPTQIDYALARLPAVDHVKLYNSGNFFDAQAIPPEDYTAIAARLQTMRTVIVENHPRMCNENCIHFRQLLPDSAELEVAIGLETVHEQVLERLNKRMTIDDFSRAAEFLHQNGIATRAFVLLRPPFLSEREGIDWALKSIEFAFSKGVRCCSIIPTRGGNGVMDQLQAQQLFSPPHLNSLEFVLETALAWGQGRVFADLWEIDRLRACTNCREQRVKRIEEMNQTQRLPVPIDCECRGVRETV